MKTRCNLGRNSRSKETDIDAESKYDLVIFSTFAERAITRQNKNYRRHMPHANALRKTSPS